MSTPRRRSSRLRGGSATPAKSINYQSNGLSSLAEDDESPTAMASVPTPRTPATAARIKPSLEEMHPSKVQQSTTKEPDMGLPLGFADIEGEHNNELSRLNRATPSKTPTAKSSFDFRFARPAPQLGPEAQRMMDDLREEALRIKAKLAAEREEKNQGHDDPLSTIGGRKIALPKGKVGRFSDIHMAEFKKMDSIAGHPSAFRAKPGISTPVKTGLKRSQSNAKLDEREDIKEDTKVYRHKSMPQGGERVENDAPAKRARKAITDDTSTARPLSRDTQPSTPRSQAKSLASLTTPTQSSLARAANMKTPTSQIPTLTRSPSKSNLSRSPSRPNLAATPRGIAKSSTMNNLGEFPRSESKLFLRGPGKIDRLKSILRHPSASAKKPSAHLSAIPSFSRSPNKPDFDKALPSIPTIPHGLQQSKSVKHVNFTPETARKNAASVLDSPSPKKSGIPRSISKINFHAKQVPSQNIRSESKPADVHYPAVSFHAGLQEKPKPVEYPSLAGFRPLPEPPVRQLTKTLPPASVPGTFSFRSDHTIDFGRSPTGFGSSPGQASVRQVRSSIFPTNMPGAFPSSGGNKENTAPVPSVPHGIQNKKRRRADSDNEEEDNFERSPKKHKITGDKTPIGGSSGIVLEEKTASSRITSPAKKKGLSLSRLNMLARPKVRK